MKAQETEDKITEEDDNEQKDDSDSDKKKNKNTSKKKKRDKENKSENTENGSKTENSKRKKNVGSEDTDDIQPKHKRRKSETDDVGKKSKNTEDDKKTKKSKDTKAKENSTEISEPVKSDAEKDTKGDSYPAKRTRSSGPVMWDCPFYEDKKYTDNLEYLVHLQKAHQCNLPGHVVKKEIKKRKLGNLSKGQGKH